MSVPPYSFNTQPTDPHLSVFPFSNANQYNAAPAAHQSCSVVPNGVFPSYGSTNLGFLPSYNDNKQNECFDWHYLSPVEKMFGNVTIVEKILEHMPCYYVPSQPYLKDIINSKEKLNLRLVNKTFKSAVHELLRKEHCKVEIFSQGTQGNYRIDINNRIVPLERIQSCFLFLKDVIEVQVNELVFQEEDVWPRQHAFFLHSEIMSSLIGYNAGYLEKLHGMELLCEGCDRCINLAEQCSEHSSLFIRNVAYGFARPAHFEKLCISYRLIHTLAGNSAQISQNEAQCMVELTKQITDKITCNCLRLNLPDTLDQQIPSEVVNIIIMQWKVKRVSLNFRKIPSDKEIGEVKKLPFFNMFRFDTAISPNMLRQSHLQSVEIDMEKSACTEQLLIKGASFYNCFLVNTRNMFPTNKIVFKFRDLFFPLPLNYLTSVILNLNDKENKRNLELYVVLKWIPADFWCQMGFDSDNSKVENPLKSIQSWNITHFHRFETVWDNSNNDFMHRKFFVLHNAPINSAINLDLTVHNDGMREHFENQKNHGMIRSGFMFHFYQLVR